MYRLDREHVKQVFKTYTDAYNSADPKIALKIEHTYYVAENADRIAASLNLSESDRDLAWLLGMLHDVGRFEQVRRYGTFVDSKSIAHALMSCEVLFPEKYDVEEHFFDEMPNGRFGRLEDYLVSGYSEDWPHIIKLAISLHSAFQLPDDLTDRERLFSQILRDADKIDILRVNVETPLTDIINCTEEEIQNSGTSPHVDEAIRDHHVVKRRPDITLTPADHIIAHICLVFELVYPESRKIVEEQGFLATLLKFRTKDPEVARKMEWLAEELDR